jgi:hypothetical protein
MAIPWNGIMELYSTDETSFYLDCECTVPCHKAKFTEEDTVTLRKAGLRHCIYKCKIFYNLQEFCSELVLIAIYTEVEANRVHQTIKQSAGKAFPSEITAKITILILLKQLAMRRPLQLKQRVWQNL